MHTFPPASRAHAFIRARLSPGGVFGLRLTLGSMALVVASWLFGAITEDVVTGDPLTLVDVEVANWLHAHAVPSITGPMLLISNLFGVAGVSVLALLLALILIWKRNWQWLWALVLVVPGGMLLNVLIKVAVARPRPVFGDPLLTLTSYSFPSGHAVAATCFCGLLVAMVFSASRDMRWRALAASTAILLVILVGFSRIYLGVHYLSDVLAGFAEGLAWLALCLTSLAALRRRRTAPGPARKGG